MKEWRTIACLSAACLLAHHAQAQIAKISSRDALAANISIEWFAFGKDGTSVFTPATRRFGNLKVELGSSAGELQLRREGTDWAGDFLPGQYLLTQPYVSDGMDVVFDPPVTALGTQIDPVGPHNGQPAYSGRFSARFCLYDAKRAFLGMVETQANADTAGDGSAKFLGARSSGNPIGRVVLEVSGVTPGFPIEGDLSVNRMDVVVPLHPAPETSPAAIVAKPPACP